MKSLFSFRLKKKKKNRRIRKYFAVIEPFQRSGKILKVNTFCEITNTFHVVPFFKICIQTDPASRIFNPPQRFTTRCKEVRGEKRKTKEKEVRKKGKRRKEKERKKTTTTRVVETQRANGRKGEAFAAVESNSKINRAVAQREK